MIKETSFETVKNSNGEVSKICHYILDTSDDAQNLPANAPVGSDALAPDAVFVRFPGGWSAV